MREHHLMDDDVVSSYNGSVSEILFDTSPCGNGRPSGATICTCKEGSTLQSKEQYGDRVVADNDKDVQHMTAIQVSKLLAKKSGHRLRKISIVRYDIA